MTVSTVDVEASVGFGFLCCLVFPALRRSRPAIDLLTAEPWSSALSPLMETLAAVATAAFGCLRLYVTDVSRPLRLPEPVDGSAETDDAREVDADFFPPEHK